MKRCGCPEFNATFSIGFGNGLKRIGSILISGNIFDMTLDVLWDHRLAGPDHGARLSATDLERRTSEVRVVTGPDSENHDGRPAGARPLITLPTWMAYSHGRDS